MLSKLDTKLCKISMMSSLVDVFFVEEGRWKRGDGSWKMGDGRFGAWFDGNELSVANATGRIISA